MTTVNNILKKFEGSLDKIQTEDFREFFGGYAKTNKRDKYVLGSRRGFGGS